MWAPNTKFISLLFLFFLFEFRLSSCNSINYISIVSCIPFFLISFSVPPFSLLNHQRYFCSFIVAVSVNTTLEREFLSASICDAFSLKALNKAFIFDKAIWSDYIVLESHIQVHLSKKKRFFSKCSVLNVSKWRRIIFKLSVFHVNNCISVLTFTHQHLNWNLKSNV